MTDLADALRQRADLGDRRADWGFRPLFVQAARFSQIDRLQVSEARAVVTSHLRHQFEIPAFSLIAVIVDAFERTNHSAEPWTGVPVGGIGPPYLLCFSNETDAVMARLAVDC